MRHDRRGVPCNNRLQSRLIGSVVDHLIRASRLPVLVVRGAIDGPYLRIIVATDLSEASKHALLVTTRLFPNADITLVHAYHVPYGAWLKSPEVQEDVRAEARTDLHHFVVRRPVWQGFEGRLDSIADEGETASVLSRQARLRQADLLVVGTKLRGTLSQAMGRSQAEMLAAGGDIDVLIVSQP